MADLVSAVGTINYNGVTFGPKTRCEIEGQSVLSTDGRTISHIIYLITVRTIIALDGQTTDATMADLRQRLQSQGGALEISETGFGPLVVNFDNELGKAKDVLWGPIPKILRWKPIGSSQACEVTWSCQVAVPECGNAQYQFALMEVNSKYSWDVDNSGYTIRSFSGFLRIPQTRREQGSRTLSDNADDYRRRIIPPAIIGFRRKQKFDIDDSKCRLDFSITDEEMPPNAPPAGMVNARASHTLQSPLPLSEKYTGSISASYEVSRDKPRKLAWLRFIELINDRIGAATQYGIQQDGTKSVPMLFNLVMTEPEIYGRESASFSINYTFFASLNTILQASGLWRVPPGSDHAVWAGSLVNGMFSPEGRGFAGLAFNNNQDTIVDLCQNSPAALASAAKIVAAHGEAVTEIKNKYPDPASSWLSYKSAVTIKQRDYAAILKGLPTAPLAPNALTSMPEFNPVLTVAGAAVSAAAEWVNKTSGYQPDYAPGTPTSDVQTRATPDYFVTLEGDAIRAGYLITPPVLTQFAGSPVKPFNDGSPTFAQKFVTSWFGVPIFSAAWRITYVLTNAVKAGFGVPPNPFIGQ